MGEEKYQLKLHGKNCMIFVLNLLSKKIAFAFERIIIYKSYVQNVRFMGI